MRVASIKEGGGFRRPLGFMDETIKGLPFFAFEQGITGDLRGRSGEHG